MMYKPLLKGCMHSCQAMLYYKILQMQNIFLLQFGIFIVFEEYMCYHQETGRRKNKIPRRLLSALVEIHSILWIWPIVRIPRSGMCTILTVVFVMQYGNTGTLKISKHAATHFGISKMQVINIFTHIVSYLYTFRNQAFPGLIVLLFLWRMRS